MAGDFGEIPNESLIVGWTYLLRELLSISEEVDDIRIPYVDYDYAGEYLTLRGFRKSGSVWRAEFLNQENGVDVYNIEVMAQRHAPDIVIPLAFMPNEHDHENHQIFDVGVRLLCDVATKTAEEHRRMVVEAARIAEERRLAEEAKKEMAVRQERQRQLEEEARRQKVAEEQRLQDQVLRAIADADKDLAIAGRLLMSSSIGTISTDLEALLPRALDWEYMLENYYDHSRKLLRIQEIHSSIRKLLLIDPNSPGDCMVVSGVFRSLLEPQCSVVIGRTLDMRGYAPIIPSYVGALMDLGYSEIAQEVCQRYWSDIETEQEPKYLLAAYHRVARVRGDTECREMLETWATTRKVELSGNRSFVELPTQKRREKRKMLSDYDDRTR